MAFRGGGGMRDASMGFSCRHPKSHFYTVRVAFRDLRSLCKQVRVYLAYPLLRMKNPIDARGTRRQGRANPIPRPAPRAPRSAMAPASARALQ